MNDVFPINQCLKPLRCIALLGNEVSCVFALVFDENFNIEGPEGFVEVRVWICIVLFAGEGEREHERDPGQPELVRICRYIGTEESVPKVMLVFPKTNNVVILLKDQGFVTDLLPIDQGAYLCAKIFESYAGPGSGICLSNV